MTLESKLLDGHPRIRNLTLLVLLTAFAILIQGYHPGLEDDAYYLAAIKRNLNPALFRTWPTFSVI